MISYLYLGTVEKQESSKFSSPFGSNNKKISRRKITPKKRNTGLQNSAASRRSSKTVIEVSSGNSGTSFQQTDQVVTQNMSFKEFGHSQGPDENDGVPGAAEYQAPFGDNTSDRAGNTRMDNMEKLLEKLYKERRQELQQLRDELREEVINVIKIAVKQLGEENMDNSKGIELRTD